MPFKLAAAEFLTRVRLESYCQQGSVTVGIGGVRGRYLGREDVVVVPWIALKILRFVLSASSYSDVQLSRMFWWFGLYVNFLEQWSQGIRASI